MYLKGYYVLWCPGEDSNLHVQKTLAPEASASTSFATWANFAITHVARAISEVNAFLWGFLTYLYLAQMR